MYANTCASTCVLNLGGQNLREDIDAKKGVVGRAALFAWKVTRAVGRGIWWCLTQAYYMCRAGAAVAREAAREAARRHAREQADAEARYEQVRAAAAAPAAAAV